MCGICRSWARSPILSVADVDLATAGLTAMKSPASVSSSTPSPGRFAVADADRQVAARASTEVALHTVTMTSLPHPGDGEDLDRDEVSLSSWSSRQRCSTQAARLLPGRVGPRMQRTWRCWNLLSLLFARPCPYKAYKEASARDRDAGCQRRPTLSPRTVALDPASRTLCPLSCLGIGPQRSRARRRIR